MTSLSNYILHKLKAVVMPSLIKGDACSALIKEELLKDTPTMIARFGAVEIKGICYPMLPYGLRIILKHKIFNPLEINAGFFPVNIESVKQFSHLMKQDMRELDILGSWRIEESILRKYLQKTRSIPLYELEPYFQLNPWSEVLENKKVLVIHPFNKTIESQYRNNREHLFQDKRVLPQFKTLETIKAVQTIAGNRCDFKDWFEALEYMKGEINKKDFDIAIIGCGAYGFPLAAHIKRMGKKAIHLGGATQILFGIKGKRWLENDKFKSIINEYFVFPSVDDIPVNADKVEGGCYW